MKYLNIIVISIFAMTLAACSSSKDSSSKEDVTHKGYLTDSALSGVTYECDGKTGLTGLDGLFECAALPVTFKLGNVTLGTLSVIPEDLKVFPQDILDIPRTDLDDSRLVAIIRFLQSLDDDGEYAEVINILEAVRTALAAEEATDILALSPAKLEALVKKTGHELVSSAVALEHLQVTLDKQNDQCNVISNHKVSAEQGQQIRIYVYGSGTDDIVVDDPENGTAGIYNVGNEEINVLYTSDADFEGIDRFEYTVNGCTRTIGVAVIKDCSFVNDVTQTTAFNTDVNFPLIENRNFESYSLSNPKDGSIGGFNINNKTVIAEYSPNKGFHGDDSFDFSINGCTRTATVTVSPPKVVVPFYDADHGWEPWVTDGTPAGTKILEDAFAGEVGSVNVERNGTFEPFVKHGDQYFYVSYPVITYSEAYTNGIHRNFKLYSATVDELKLLKSELDNTSGGTIIKGFDKNVYFRASDDQGANVWKTNGTVGGTSMVFNADPDSSVNGVNYPIIFDDQLFFMVNSHAGENGGGKGIYKSNGTAAGTALVYGLQDDQTNLYATDSKIYFQGSDDQPWMTDGVDGTSAHTKLLKEVYTGGASNAGSFTQVGSTVYFSAKDNNNSGYRSLWKTTGVAGNAEVVRSFPHRSVGGEFLACNSKLYFSHSGLYVSDGTSEGTIHEPALDEITSGHYVGSGHMRCFDDVLYVIASNSTTDAKNIYSVSATGVKTVVNADDSVYLEIMPDMIDGAVIFHTQSATEVKLWKHDAVNGTVLLKASALDIPL